MNIEGALDGFKIYLQPRVAAMLVATAGAIEIYAALGVTGAAGWAIVYTAKAMLLGAGMAAAD